MTVLAAHFLIDDMAKKMRRGWFRDREAEEQWRAVAEGLRRSLEHGKPETITDR